MAVTKYIFVICVLTSLIGTGADRDTRHTANEQSFEAFMVKHGRSYLKGTGEYEMRRALYQRRFKEMQEHNNRPGRLWTAGINYLSDWTEPELRQLRGSRPMRSRKSPGALRSHGVLQSDGKFLAQVSDVVVPEQWSWANLSAVQQPKDQGYCGSCWALATTIALQANAEIKGYERTFSAQELVDCVPNPHNCGGTGGCEGSTVELAMNWVMETGLDDLATYPGAPYGYAGNCKKTTAPSAYLLEGRNDGDTSGDDSLEDMIKIGFHGPKSSTSPGALLGLRGWTRLPENEYQPLLNAVLEGPVAASIDASDWAFYSSGIYNNCEKDAVINHAVTLVGFGSQARTAGHHSQHNTFLASGFSGITDKYWTIKNSWGNYWGENGLIRLLRIEGDSHCGVDKEPEKGTGCTNPWGPKEVTVCGMCGLHYDNVAMHFDPKE